MVMSLEERIEAMALSIATYVELPYETLGESWMRFQLLPANDKERSRRLARAALRAAFPELFSDPPRAWIAPWELTPRMKNAYFGALRKPKDKRKYPAVEKSELRWAAMRNAFLHPTRTSTDNGGDQ